MNEKEMSILSNRAWDEDQMFLWCWRFLKFLDNSICVPNCLLIETVTLFYSSPLLLVYKQAYRNIYMCLNLPYYFFLLLLLPLSDVFICRDGFIFIQLPKK
jgi:hypothetical protein